jgi:hypothetical protein
VHYITACGDGRIAATRAFDVDDYRTVQDFIVAIELVLKGQFNEGA